MRLRLIFAFSCLLATRVMAQLPYFAPTVGDGKLYGYTSMKARPGINNMETYTTFQYGIGEHFAPGIDLYTGPGCAYWGALIRYGHKICKWFNVGAEVIPSFDLNNSFRFAYISSALYMNGALTNNGNLFWCTNTWWTARREDANSIVNNEYLGYTIPFRNGHSITPMIGAIHSWRFDQDVDITAGFYYTIKNWSVYVWGNDFLKSHPRFILGVEFIL